MDSRKMEASKKHCLYQLTSLCLVLLYWLAFILLSPSTHVSGRFSQQSVLKFSSSSLVYCFLLVFQSEFKHLLFREVFLAYPFCKRRKKIKRTHFFLCRENSSSSLPCVSFLCVSYHSHKMPHSVYQCVGFSPTSRNFP